MKSRYFLRGMRSLIIAMPMFEDLRMTPMVSCVP